MQPYLLEVLPIDQDSTSTAFGETKEDLEDRGFTSTGSTYDSNFHASLDEAVQINKRGLHTLSVFHRHILELNVSLDRPVLLGELFVYSLILFVLWFKFGVAVDSLGAGHHVLEFGVISDWDGEQEYNIEDDL